MTASMCPRCDRMVEETAKGRRKAHLGPFGPCLDKVRCHQCQEVVWVNEDNLIKGHLVYVTMNGRTETCPGTGTVPDAG